MSGGVGWVVLGGCALAALVGPVASSLHLTYGVAGVLAVGALLAASARHPIGGVIAVAVVLIASLNDLPQRLPVGPTTAQGVETIALITVVALAYMSGYSARGVAERRRLMPVAVFLLWAVISFSWGHLSLEGVQNVAVYAAFLGMLVIGASIGRWRPDESHHALDVAFRVAAVAGLSLYAVSHAFGGDNIRLIVSPRPFGLFGVLVVSWFMAAHINGSRVAKWIIAATVVLTALSLSRSALAAQFVVIALGYVGTTTDFRRLLRAAVATMVVASVALSAVFFYKPLHDRFFVGDTQLVGGISLNVMGRDAVWSANWEWFKEKPLIGWGAGASNRMTSALPDGAGANIAHPHNDYLRILVDFGVVGLAIWIFGYLGLFGLAWRRWRAAVHSRTPAEHVSCAAFLALTGIGLTMMVDNPLIEIAKMAPLGAVVGMAVGMVVPEPRRAVAPEPAPAAQAPRVLSSAH